MSVRYEYDSASVPFAKGRLTKVIDNSGETRVLGYDKHGRQTGVIRRIDVDDVVGEAKFEYVYNRSDEIVEIEYPDGEVVQISYDESGQPIGLYNAYGYIYAAGVKYNARGQLTHLGKGFDLDAVPPQPLVAETRGYYSTGGPNDPSGTRLASLAIDGGALLDLSYAYNARGQVKTVTHYDVPATNLNAGGTYAYDDLGRLASYQSNASGAVLREYDYNQWGNITVKDGMQIAYGNPTNAATAPHRISHFSLSGGPDRYLSHDANGNRLQNYQDGVVASQLNVYDAEDRLRETVPQGGSSKVIFHYDGGGQLKAKVVDPIVGNSDVTRYYAPEIEVRPDGKTIKSYFFAGQRVASVVSANSAWQDDTLASASWVSGVEVASTWSGRPIFAMGLSPGAQNVVAMSAALLAVALFLLPPGRRRRAVLGLRLGRGTTLFLTLVVSTGTLPWPLLIQPAGAQCDPLPDPPAAANVRYFHYDHLGSPVAITDGNGDLVEHIRYHPYGTVRGRYDAGGSTIGDPGPGDVRYEFTGYEADRSTGLLYANARFYDPELGIFMTHDPAAEFWSPYSYVGWDPANLTDPSGRDVSAALFVALLIGFAASSISAAIQGASFGKALEAGLVGGATSVLGAAIGVSLLQPALQGLVGGLATTLGKTGQQLSSDILFVSGLGQAGYGASQGDYGGVIGFGLGLTVGAYMARGARESVSKGGNGVSTARQLKFAQDAYGQKFNWTTLEIYARPTALGAGVATHGIGYLPNPDAVGSGVSVEGLAGINGETWGDTIGNVSRGSGAGSLLGNATAVYARTTVADIYADGDQLVDTVQIPGSFGHAAAAAKTYAGAVTAAGVAYNPLPVLGGANSNTVLYSLNPALGGPQLAPHWRAVGGGKPFPFPR